MTELDRAVEAARSSMNLTAPEAEGYGYLDRTDVADALRAAVPGLLDGLTQRIDEVGRGQVEFLAGDQTKLGRYRKIGAEDAYRDALRIVEDYRREITNA